MAALARACAVGALGARTAAVRTAAAATAPAVARRAFATEAQPAPAPNPAVPSSRFHEVRAAGTTRRYAGAANPDERRA